MPEEQEPWSYGVHCQRWTGGVCQGVRRFKPQDRQESRKHHTFWSGLDVKGFCCYAHGETTS